MQFYKITMKGDFSKVLKKKACKDDFSAFLTSSKCKALSKVHLFRHEERSCNMLPNRDLFFCPCDTDRKTYVDFFAAFSVRCNGFAEVSAVILELIRKELKVQAVPGEYAEISLESYLNLFDKADDDDMFTRNELFPSCPYMNSESTGLLSRHYFRWSDGVADSKTWDRRQALREFSQICLPGNELGGEMERIYAPVPVSGIFGHPVHYYIESPDLESGMKVVSFIIRMLYSRGRLLSRRYGVLHMNSYDNRRGSTDSAEELRLFLSLHDCASVVAVFENENSGENGGCLVNDGREHLSELLKFMDGSSLNTLYFIICVAPEKSAESKTPLVSVVEEKVALVRIRTGFGTREQAVSYMKDLVVRAGYEKWIDDAVAQIRGNSRTEYSMSIVNDIFRSWTRRVLCNTVYDYGKMFRPEKAKRKVRGRSACQRLGDMIGLERVKEIIDRIIAVSVVARRRKTLGLDESGRSRHMIFTGNPGTAKTTVARLLSEILREEGVLAHGSFVECGRADLVARYVGWTAKTVKEMFDRAEGGILFIDEAYSLAHDTRSGFGAEAIDTIVQEMENRRERMIVIMAGYAEPMKKLLKANAGLASRIAFHVDFPDYSPDDLEGIMKLMLRERQLAVSEEALDKCREIFRKAVARDDFGNGRFVRNLIEGAELAQARRLRDIYGRKAIPKRALTELGAEDFSLPESLNSQVRKGSRIGFLC
ncbi:AAA family ATPase [Succinimonas amylolytica]|uniref:AAA family ATPase n=1 Tax=Succinimonas amylolytica TaxID=83769 RepID=UPI0023A8679C